MWISVGREIVNLGHVVRTEDLTRDRMGDFGIAVIDGVRLHLANGASVDAWGELAVQVKGALLALCQRTRDHLGEDVGERARNAA